MMVRPSLPLLRHWSAAECVLLKDALYGFRFKRPIKRLEYVPLNPPFASIFDLANLRL